MNSKDDNLPISTREIDDLIRDLDRDPSADATGSPEWEIDVRTFCANVSERDGELQKLLTANDPAHADSYAILHKLALRGLNSAGACQLLACLCDFVLTRKSEAEQCIWLERWLESPGGDVFCILPALPRLLESLQLPASVAGPWLLSIYARVKNDLANGPFFEALTTYARRWPEEALSLVEQNSSAFDSDRIVLVGTVLGGLFAASLSEPLVRRRDCIEAALHVSSDVSHRRAAYQACRCRVVAGNATNEELKVWFAELSHAALELRTEGFALARLVTTTRSDNEGALAMALQWLAEHARGEIDETAKHQVITVVEMLLAPRSGLPANSEAAFALIRNILPLPATESGLWNPVSSLFFHLVERNRAALPEVLRALVSDGGKGANAAFSRGELASSLTVWLHSAEGAATVADLCFSKSNGERQLGLTLFEKAGMAEFPAEKLARLDETAILRSLYQSQLTSFVSDVVSRYLLALLPRIQTCGETVQEEYYEELLYQAENLPRGCLEVLRQHPSPTEALRSVITRADQYGEGLKECSRSPIGQMAVPHLRGALRIQSRRFSRSMSEGFKRGSSLLSFFHSVSVLYGRSFSQYQEGNLSDATPMGEIKHEWELPRFLLMDPEASAMRRLQAGANIQRLEEVD